MVKAVVGGMPGSHGTFLSSWPASLREQPFSCCSLAHLTKPDTRRASKAKGILGGLKLSKGLFRLVLAHLGAEHLHLELVSRGCGAAGTCRLHGSPRVRTSCSIPGATYPLRQSPTAVLATGDSPGKGSQSQEGFLCPKTQAHANGLAGCY